MLGGFILSVVDITELFTILQILVHFITVNYINILSFFINENSIKTQITRAY